jgi:hypothetical protein
MVVKALPLLTSIYVQMLPDEAVEERLVEILERPDVADPQQLGTIIEAGCAQRNVGEATMNAFRVVWWARVGR